MTIVSDEYLQLANEKAGGVNEAALDSLVYWNNPLHLKHWTMNIIELLMIFGAIAAFIHAWQVYKRQGNPANLCLWFACIVYLLVCEVPLYFPHLLGLDIGLVFMHNEFTTGILYNQTPLYIVALYPALIYPSYLLIENSGIFHRKYGLLLGAICVGFIHHLFYEIFDNFGPQYIWWVWNFDNPLIAVTYKSVPMASMVVFALTPPMVATILFRLLVVRYIGRRQAVKASVSGAAVLVLLTLLLGILIPVINGILPTAAISGLGLSESMALALYFAVIALAGVICITTLARHSISVESNLWRYPCNYLLLFLGVHAFLWLVALPEYFAAVEGITAMGTPVGSLPYVIGCFVLAVYCLYRLTTVSAKAPLSSTSAIR